MKKILILASVASMISQFNLSNIEILLELGYEVHVACNFLEGNTCNQEEVQRLKAYLTKKQIRYFQIDFSRNISNLRKNIKAYQQVSGLLNENRYTLLHCHSPIGGFVGRIAALQAKIPAIYTAHGFHFYRGAPFMNWIIFFPAEWLCSWMTHRLITINKEDYDRAGRCLHAGETLYIPGIGIDLERFRRVEGPGVRIKIRNELGVTGREKLLLSVGELNDNKNHEVIIKALSRLKDIEFQYVICGEGRRKGYLKELVKTFSLQRNVRFLGYRTDIQEIYQAADLFIFPSKREGLSVALMEAMASGLPVVCSKIRGNTDLIDHESNGCLVKHVTDPDEYYQAIHRLLKNETLLSQAGKRNREKIKQFDSNIVREKTRQIYRKYGDA